MTHQELAERIEAVRRELREAELRYEVVRAKVRLLQLERELYDYERNAK